MEIQLTEQLNMLNVKEGQDRNFLKAQLIDGQK